jgi:hypothetical protein
MDAVLKRIAELVLGKNYRLVPDLRFPFDMFGVISTDTDYCFYRYVKEEDGRGRKTPRF